MNALSCHSSNCFGRADTPLNNWSLRKLENACLSADDALHARKAALFAHANGVVLEIGAAVGVNRKYVSHAERYLALEPERGFCDRLNAIADAVLCARVESIPLPAESVETVVCSMTLCSVRDLSAALDEVCRVLRPNGRFLVIEHVGAPRGTFLRFCQRVFRPVCQCLDRGCRPDRNTSEALHSCGLRMADYTKFQLKLKTPLIRDWIAASLVKHTGNCAVT